MPPFKTIPFVGGPICGMRQSIPLDLPDGSTFEAPGYKAIYHYKYELSRNRFFCVGSVAREVAR